jgi:hypothetical protein
VRQDPAPALILPVAAESCETITCMLGGVDLLQDGFAAFSGKLGQVLAGIRDEGVLLGASAGVLDGACNTLNSTWAGSLEGPAARR